MKLLKSKILKNADVDNFSSLQINNSSQPTFKLSTTKRKEKFASTNKILTPFNALKKI